MTYLPATPDGHSPPTVLSAALQQLDVHGTITLPGRPSAATLRWLSRRRLMRGIGFGVLVVGVMLAVMGGVLRGQGVWALLIPLGVLLAFVGSVWFGVVFLMRRLMGPRLFAESRPVVLDQQGVRLRGIGPIPWHDLMPPVQMRVTVRNDIGGNCTLMPLTQHGHTLVDSQPAPWRNLVGPKPYLRADTPYLLLPGIDGLTEEETLQLFAWAHRRFAL